MLRVGIVGLGIMGTAYARNLIESGFPVAGFDIAPDSVDHLVGMGGRACNSPGSLAASSDVILTALPNVKALEEVTPDLVDGVSPGKVVIEMSTFPIEAKERLEESLRGAGAACVDAPASGTGLQAEQADIVVYASGEPDAIAEVMPVFDAIGRGTFDLGRFGNGSKMKFLANLLVSIHNLATAEAFVLGRAAGLDPEQILKVISAGAGSSRIFEIRGPMMVTDDYPPATGFAMFVKDINVIGEFADSLGAPTPLLDATLPWYEEAIAEGLGELDAGALAQLLASKLSERP